jgi:hypothetical protein
MTTFGYKTAYCLKSLVKNLLFTENVRMNRINTPDFSVKVVRSPRRKTMALSIKDAEVTLRIPSRLPFKQAESFVISKAAWVKQKLSQQKPAPTYLYQEGEQFWFQGRPLTLTIREGQPEHSVQAEASQLVLCNKMSSPSPDSLSRQLSRWYRQQAESYLQARCHELAANTHLMPRSVTIKTYKARWGSCRINGDIQLNWKLIMAPVAVIDYVIIHELCHLKQHNHSPAFWQLVENFCPEFRLHRLWLKQYGSQLTL